MLMYQIKIEMEGYLNTCITRVEVEISLKSFGNGDKVGNTGRGDGWNEGCPDGCIEGCLDGCIEGCTEGCTVGCDEGLAIG